MIKKSGLLIAGVFSALLFTELTLRYFFPQPVYSTLYNDKMNCYKPDPIAYVALKKNSTCYYARSGKEYTAKTTTNNLGYREENPINLIKKSGTKRVVFIGDSFTFGQGVKTADAFPNITEIQLNQMIKNVETINAGIIGVGAEWYYLTLKEKITPLKPDIVVVGLYLGNDLSDIDYFKWTELDQNGLPKKITTEYEFIDADGSRRLTTTPLRYRIPFLRDSHLVIFVANKFLGSSPSGNTEDIAFSGSPCYLNPECNDSAGQEKKIEQLVVGVKKIAKQHNFRLVIVLIPWELQLKRELLQRSGINIFVTKERRYLLSNRIEKMLQNNDIMTLNLLPVFDTYSGNKKIIYPIDRHWTKEGHKIAGEAIAEALIPLLDKSTDRTPSLSSSSGQTMTEEKRK